MPTLQQLQTNQLRQQKGLVDTKGSGLTPTSGLSSLAQAPAPAPAPAPTAPAPSAATGGDGGASIANLFNTEAARQGKTVTPTSTGGGLSTLAQAPTAASLSQAAGAPSTASNADSGLSSLMNGGNAFQMSGIVPGSDPTKPGTGPAGGGIPNPPSPQLPNAFPIQTDTWGDIMAPLSGLAEKQWGGYGNTPQYGDAPTGTSADASALARSGNGTYTPFTLGQEQYANQYNRNLQFQGATGLNQLANDPTNEARINQLSQDIYQPQAQAINQAARTQQQQMLEGTFAKGVGSSSITEDLAGKLAQAQDTALGNAQQNAYVAARGQANQDLASYQNLMQGLYSAGTSGLQAEANVGLANAQNQMAAGQFGQGMQFTAQQNDANRALQQAMQSTGFQFTGDQAALQRQFDQNMATMGYAAQAGSQASNQRFQSAMQQSSQMEQERQQTMGYSAQSAMLTQQQQYDAARLASQQNYQTIQDTRQQGFESNMLGSQQNFTALENAKSRGWQATQNEAQRQMQILLQTMQNAQAGTPRPRPC